MLAYGGNAGHRAGARAGAGHHALPRLRPQARASAWSARAALDTQRGAGDGAPGGARHRALRAAGLLFAAPVLRGARRRVSTRATFAQYLAAELANLQQRFPRRALALEEAAAPSRLAAGGANCSRWPATARELLGDARCGLGRGLRRHAAAAGAHRRRAQHPGVRGGRAGRGRAAARAARRLPADRRHRRRRRASCSASPKLLGRRRRHAHLRAGRDDRARGRLAPRRPLQPAGPGAHGGDRGRRRARGRRGSRPTRRRMADEPSCRCSGVRFAFPGWPPTVDGADSRWRQGEFHCLVGRSGCGKTTLLKLAAGLLLPDAGPRVPLRGAAGRSRTSASCSSRPPCWSGCA